jgi:hypothetical protein
VNGWALVCVVCVSVCVCVCVCVMGWWGGTVACSAALSAYSCCTCNTYTEGRNPSERFQMSARPFSFSNHSSYSLYACRAFSPSVAYSTAAILQCMSLSDQALRISGSHSTRCRSLPLRFHRPDTRCGSAYANCDDSTCSQQLGSHADDDRKPPYSMAIIRVKKPSELSVH